MSMIGSSGIGRMEHCILAYALALGRWYTLDKNRKNHGNKSIYLRTQSK